MKTRIEDFEKFLYTSSRCSKSFVVYHSC